MTPVEREINHWAQMGLTDKEIGDTLHLSEHTIGTHLRAMFQRYGVHRRTQLAMKLVEVKINDNRPFMGTTTCQ